MGKYISRAYKKKLGGVFVAVVFCVFVFFWGGGEVVFWVFLRKSYVHISSYDSYYIS